MLVQFLRDDRGATAIEYGLIAALVAVVIIGAVTTLGIHISDKLLHIDLAVMTAGS
jgi:pilus assembly protein Flp/PilA